MTDTRLLLLDTNVVLHLVRGKATGEALDRAYGVRARPDRPLISIITIGEMMAMAKRLNWGAKKVETLKRLAGELVVVDVQNPDSPPQVRRDRRVRRQERPRAQRQRCLDRGDRVSIGAVLLTTDKDFDPLHDVFLTRIYFNPAVS